jgi:hypothetical protein
MRMCSELSSGVEHPLLFGIVENTGVLSHGTTEEN